MTSVIDSVVHDLVIDIKTLTVSAVMSCRLLNATEASPWSSILVGNTYRRRSHRQKFPDVHTAAGPIGVPALSAIVHADAATSPASPTIATDYLGCTNKPRLRTYSCILSAW